jgi:hypothetical protein
LSNYVQSTNFATKDALSSGDPLKIVKGTEINTEFNNIATAVATKADLVSPTFTGTPAAPTAPPSTNNTQIATTAYTDAAIAAYDAALTVSASQIETDAVTTVKILDANVTTAKILDANVTTAKILDANVTSAKLADSGVVAASYGTSTSVPTIAVNAKGQITSASNTNIPLIGSGQSWQNLIASRALGTTYTNATSKPIMVSVQCSQSSAIVVTILIVDGVEVAWSGANGAGANALGVCTIVPAGSTYSAINGTLLNWAELR